MNVEYLLCRHCGHRFGIAAGTGKLMTQSLPDPFEATCPHCNKKALYEKGSVLNVPLASSKE